jgi:integrase
MLYRRGRMWWFKFKFAGQNIRESTKTSSKTIARAAELKRRRELEEGYNGLRKRERPMLFKVAARAWLDSKRLTLAPKSVRIEETSLRHLAVDFDNLLITDISAQDIRQYQNKRLRDGRSPKTVNLEVGTLRAILRRHRLWGNLQPEVQMLRVTDDVGRALTRDDERRLLSACGASRSKALLPVVTLAMHTAMRYSELLTLRWGQVDLDGEKLVVGRSKTIAGTGRGIPLNQSAAATLRTWSARFPERRPDHFVFPAEKYGVSGDDAVPHTWGTNPTKHLKSLKEAWETAKAQAKITCRFHDLRHTATTRMLERGAPLPVVASLLGWSAATTVRMMKRYGHIGQVAQREAVELLQITKHAMPRENRKSPISQVRREQCGDGTLGPGSVEKSNRVGTEIGHTTRALLKVMPLKLLI